MASDRARRVLELVAETSQPQCETPVEVGVVPAVRTRRYTFLAAAVTVIVIVVGFAIIRLDAPRPPTRTAGITKQDWADINAALQTAATPINTYPATPSCTAVSSYSFAPIPLVTGMLEGRRVHVRLSNSRNIPIYLGLPGTHIYVTERWSRDTVIVRLTTGGTLLLAAGQECELVSDPLPNGFEPNLAYYEVTCPDGGMTGTFGRIERSDK